MPDLHLNKIPAGNRYFHLFEVLVTVIFGFLEMETLISTVGNCYFRCRKSLFSEMGTVIFFAFCGMCYVARD
jgi:hypothetical protein